MHFPSFLALKYLRPRRSIASVIMCVSILGVMLGIAAVVIVRSVMTGFGDIWESKILDFKPHITLMPEAGRATIPDETSVVNRLKGIRELTSVTPEIDTRVMISAHGRVLAPALIGIGGDDFSRAYSVGRPLAGTFDLEPDTLIIGRHIARQLGVWAGDEIVVYSPKSLVDQNEIVLPMKWRVGGIFSSGQYDYDSNFVVCSLDSARDLLAMEHGVFAIHLKTSCPTDHKRFSLLQDEVTRAIPELNQLSWREADKELFSVLAVEKNMTAILLLLISVVALFCVMNTLLVLTVQKTPEIGLLKALGFSRGQIMSVFVIHGLVQCTIGIVLGLLASWAILSNLSQIVEGLAHFGLTVFPESVYGLAEIPHRIVVADIVWTVLFVYVFGLLASLIPASVAALKDPVQALKE